MTSQTPLKYKVAINCLVYNHAPYLRDCLEGFVMQQTDFPFVAIVHDDASTDHSADIIREYAAKYPDIIHPIYETENQYSKKDGSLTKIMDAAIEATGAPYIAICEGDDYWTDPHKLQKQVDFLETHLEYTLCFHNVKVFNTQTGKMLTDFIMKDIQGESTIIDLAKGNYIHTPSVVYKNNEEIILKRRKLGSCLPGDYVLWMLLGDYGKFYKMEDTMAVYRYGCGIWSGSWNLEKALYEFKTFSKLYVMIDNEKARNVLDNQIQGLFNKMILQENETHTQLLQLRASHAYRLGKLMLKPFHWVKHRMMS